MPRILLSRFSLVLVLPLSPECLTSSAISRTYASINEKIFVFAAGSFMLRYVRSMQYWVAKRKKRVNGSSPFRIPCIFIFATNTLKPLSGSRLLLVLRWMPTQSLSKYSARSWNPGGSSTSDRAWATPAWM
uniref:Putative secreted protein n=1 Tax=Anopheles marajoara TaxID=58244 RepID=A0A2M4C6X0_9DIPT